MNMDPEENDCWHVIESYFKHKHLEQLVKHQTESYNDFIQNQMKKEYWPAIGYIKISNFALRVDVFERIFFIARQKIKNGPFVDSSDLMNPVGCDRNELRDILIFCGFSALKFNNDRDLYYNGLKKHLKKIIKDKTKKIHIKKNTKTTKLLNNNKKPADPNSPFAVLEKLL